MVDRGNVGKVLEKKADIREITRRDIFWKIQGKKWITISSGACKEGRFAFHFVI